MLLVKANREEGGRNVRGEQGAGAALLPRGELRNMDIIDGLFADERVAAGVRRGCGTYLAAFPDLHTSVEELIAEGHRVVSRTNTTGTHDGEIKGIAPTGRQVSMDAAEIFRIK